MTITNIFFDGAPFVRQRVQEGWVMMKHGKIIFAPLSQFCSGNKFHAPLSVFCCITHACNGACCI